MDRVLRRRQVAVRRRWCGEVRNREACLGSPQGSNLGPLFFATYVSPIGQVVDTFGIQHHQYADDLMLYCAVTASQLDDLSPLVRCSDAVSPSERATAKSEQDGSCIVRDQAADSRRGF